MSTFYRKYRPLCFADVIGQEQAVTVLTQGLLRDKVAHAYLLTGPRGTGKTTLARIFAQALNCSGRKKKSAEPCGSCPHCAAMREHQSLDVLEIDAASHTGVDHIRELKSTLDTAPVLGRYKIYIIDEAHMLSIGAWNALLKTLEEPPAHVIFLLATTNIGKVPETILSRSLRLDLRRFPIEHLLKKLKRVAQAEKIDIDDASLSLIARQAQGGMRDAEILFTQVATLEESPIRIDRTAELLGGTTIETLATILRAIALDDLPQGLTLVRRLGEQGTNLQQFLTHLLQYLRQALYASVSGEPSVLLSFDLTETEQAELASVAQTLGSQRIIECLERFQEAEAAIKYSPLPELPLEIALVKLIRHTVSKDQHPPGTPGHTTESSVSPKTTAPPQSVAPKKVSPLKARVTQRPTAIDFSQVKREWRAIVEHAQALNASLGVALSTTELILDVEEEAILEVKYPFHKDRLEKAENRLTIDTAFATILGFQVPWRVQVASSQSATDSPLLSQALEALGGKLVSEN